MSNTLITDVLTDFNLGDLSISSEDLYGSGSTIALRRGETIAMQVSLGSNTLDAQMTLRSAMLTRLSVLENEYQKREGETYLQVTGVMNPVDLEVVVQHNGEWIEIEEFLCRIYNAKANTDNNKLDLDAFKARLTGLGFRHGRGATIMWHHFGVDENDLAEIVQVLRNAGAEDNLGSIPEERRGRIKEVWKFAEGTGLEIEGFEVTSQDRTESRTGQGFTNFVESAVESFVRTLQIKAQLKVVDATLQKAQSDSNAMDEAAAKKLQAYLIRQSTAWSSNLSGVQQRKRQNESGEVIEVGEGPDNPSDVCIDPVNAPIGRITYVAGKNDDDSPLHKTLDFWRRNTTAPTLPDVEMIENAESEEAETEAAESEEEKFG